MRLHRFIIDRRAWMLVDKDWYWVLRGRPRRLTEKDREIYGWGPGVIHHRRIGLSQEVGRGGMGVTCPVCEASPCHWCVHEENEGFRPLTPEPYHKVNWGY